MNVKGSIVHLVEGSGGRWIIAWRTDPDTWATNVHPRERQRQSGPLIQGATLAELVTHGAATFASSQGATKRARQLAIGGGATDPPKKRKPKLSAGFGNTTKAEGLREAARLLEGWRYDMKDGREAEWTRHLAQRLHQHANKLDGVTP